MSCSRKLLPAAGMSLAMGLLAGAPNVLAKGTADILMEEVLVYGTKQDTAQKAQDVAAQVTAFSASQLDAKQVLTLEDLSFSTPNVQLDSIGTQASYAAFSIRGLGIDNSTPSIDPNVGVFIDGVYLGVGFGVVTDTFDVESVEIYKGPQSLLFGRNVTGGAVLLRSKRPTGDFGVNIKAGYETDQYVVAAAVEGTLIEDTLMARVSLQHRDDDGWFDNEFLDKKTGAQTSDLFKAAFVFTPTENLDITLLVEDGRMRGDASPVQNLYDPVLFAQPVNKYTPSNPIIPSNDDFNVSHDHVGDGDVDWSQYTLEMSLDFGESQLTNIMSYREVEAYASADIDGRETASLVTQYDFKQHQFSNEIRLNLQPVDAWTTTIGASYFRQEYAYTTALRIGTFDILPGGNDRVGGGTQEQSSWSIYWNNEFALTDSLSLVGGLNYLKEKKDVRLVARTKDSVTNGLCDVELLSCIWSLGSPGGEDWGNLSAKLGLTWQMNDDVQLYGHWSTAYRSGFYNLRPSVQARVDNPTPTDLEEHNVFEIGVKSYLADGQVRVNAAWFYQDIKDLARSSGFILPGGTPAQNLQNVGDAVISGFEVDVMARVGENLILTAAVGYLDGDITDAAADINNNGDLTDDESLAITRLSDWTANLGVSYDLAVGDVGLLTFRADYNYRSEAAAIDSNTAFFPSTKIANAGVTYSHGEGNWTVSLYGKNLTDQVVYSSLFPVSSARVYAPIKEGRRYGLEFRYSL